jgi:hypothetical protein
MGWNITKLYNEFLFLMGLGFEFMASHLQSRQLYCLSHTSSPFRCGRFGDGVSWTILSQLVLNLNPHNLSLPIS